MSYAAENQGFEGTETQSGMKRAEGPSIQEVMKANIELTASIGQDVNHLNDRLQPILRPVLEVADPGGKSDGQEQPPLLATLQDHHRQLMRVREEVRTITRGLVL